MGSLELLSYFWSLNTILVVKIANFDFDGLSPPPLTLVAKEVNHPFFNIFNQLIKIRRIFKIHFHFIRQFDIIQSQ